jgi:hypothetical protein
VNLLFGVSADAEALRTRAADKAPHGAVLAPAATDA